MPIYPFERTVLPSRFPSPFIGKRGAVKGPGGIIDAVVEDDKGEATSGGRKRTRRNPGGDAGPSKGLYAGGTAQGTNAAAASSHYQYQPSNLSQQLNIPHNLRATGPDRSVITAAGGLTFLGHNAQIEKLPPETGGLHLFAEWDAELTLSPPLAKHFDRDPETNEVLWFPAPPVDVAKPSKAKYSLAYLHFLAAKRKGETEYMDSEEILTPAKRIRFQAPPTITETLRAVLRQ